MAEPRSMDCEATESAAGTMRVRVHVLAQLFNSIDPSPFHERELDRAAERFIVDWVREIPACAPLALEVQVEGRPALDESDEALAEALHAHFGRRAETVRRELRTLLRRGRISLAIGLVFLSACVLASDLAVSLAGRSGPGEIIQQGLTVAGWVAMWRPMEIFLYAWWPLVQDRRLYDRLSRMPVRVQIGPWPGSAATDLPRHGGPTANPGEDRL